MAKMPRCAPDVRSQAISELMNADGGADAIKKLAQTVVETKGNGLGLNSVVRQAMRPDWKKALLQLRINGLLSSPKTHIVNIVGNKLIATMSIPERYLAAGISKVMPSGEITFGEVNAQAFGYVEGVKDGIKLLARGSKAQGDEKVGDLFSMFRPAENTYVDHLVPEVVGMDDGSAIGKGLAYAGKALNVPTALMGKADDYFKAVGYRMELNALAHRQAVSEGLEGEDFLARIQDLKNNPPDHMQVEAFEVARYQTFTNDLGDIGRKMQTAINSNFAMKMVFPFVRTPANILKYTFERTPLAPLSASIRADIRAGGARGAQAQARIAMGSMLIMAGHSMALQGKVTGKGSEDPNQRKIAMGNGWQPYSLKIGDSWYAYNRLDPLGMILGLGADIAEIQNGVDEDASAMMIAAGVAAMTKNLASKTYLSGAFDLMAALDDGNFKGDIDDYLINQAFTFVPFGSFVRNVSRATDPTLRDAKAYDEDPNAEFVSQLVNSFRKNIPGQSADLPPRYDFYGEVIDQSSQFGFLYDLASPIATRVDDPDPISTVILENQIPVSWPKRTVRGVKLKPEEYAEYSKTAGKMVKDSLSALVGSAGFKNLSGGAEGMKSQLVRRMIDQSRDTAAKMLISSSPDIQERITQKKIDKVKNLQGEKE